MGSMEATTLEQPHLGVRGPTPLLRLQGDERLVALTRRGNQAAYEALVARYQSRLLAFCRHMLGSREDAEDVLQEVFAAAFNAMLADDRADQRAAVAVPDRAQPLLNHLRRAQAIGVDSMDVHLAEHGTTTADKVHSREEFRQLRRRRAGRCPRRSAPRCCCARSTRCPTSRSPRRWRPRSRRVKSLLVRARVVAGRGRRGAPL